ncbi:elongation factor G [Kutzneria kofuensis]|uniref:Ribosomal protection tetracycline resistance protein n=1 Tax=Kutzneria kofuensis TaxID=103725 RepID=A0A7W9KB61_9PSEU|nr:TetM/TetW/TetO/TetS family tetracycline resistance ribosomal protection protein [Kutzneria kofuensis]MBB5889367.1 ribosomal protection tetracycline resistance protein [Kutzneria kofuensis]
MAVLNLGILAHVDAGKTSLTERLLFTAGIIDEIGSVDDGNTQTDSMALERRRGITIKSAVVSFTLGDRTVNLIDTPGHPDFIAEVERVLGVLDGAVLVVSAVEGVQAQTRILMRVLRRLRIPTLIFVNKVDRGGARYDELLADISAKLSSSIVPMGSVSGLGTRAARAVPFGAGDLDFVERLIELDDDLTAAYLSATEVPYEQALSTLAERSRRGLAHPVYFGSAITGTGVDALAEGITSFLPTAPSDADAPVSGTVFKVERGPAGEKIAYVRMHAGTLRVRDRLPDSDDKVTAISVFSAGTSVSRSAVSAGSIAKLWGLNGIRIGDTIGSSPGAAERYFSLPTLETVVLPARSGERGTLRAALDQLAEQDPLIDVRQDEIRREISVSLYGEVQKEVIQATLAEEFGLEVSFRETTTINVERVVGTGAAFEIMHVQPNPFLATVGLRIEPGPIDSGVRYRLGVELGSMPYAFMKAVEDTVRETLLQGLHGWQVIDCVVTMTHSGYSPRQSHMHATFDKSMSSTGADFRGLTPLVLMSALAKAGTRVHEPIHRYQLEIPTEAFAAVLPVLVNLRAAPLMSSIRGGTHVLSGDIPAAEVHGLERRLPSLTSGEGVLESAFDHYRPVDGPAPDRPRWDHNPLNRKEYLLHVLRRV